MGVEVSPGEGDGNPQEIGPARDQSMEISAWDQQLLSLRSEWSECVASLDKSNNAASWVDLGLGN